MADARRLVLFNHKGGVGKTTLSVNIACALHAAGKRVLFVDTDPQCSLSSYFLEENFLDQLLDQSEGPKGNTLWSALRPVSEGTGAAKAIKPIKVREGMFLAVGDIRLAQFESSLSDCWNLCLSRNRRGYNVTGALSALVGEMADSVKADFVFYDAGPNVGPLNRIVLLDCSHFVVPAACDLFSSRALKTLGFSLSDWVATWERIRAMAPEGTVLFNGTPQLLGYIPQGFRVYRGEMATAPLSLLSKLESRVAEFVSKPLHAAMGLSAKEKVASHKLGQVRFYGTLSTSAQNTGQALWEVSGGNVESKADAKKVFAEIAKRIVELT